MPNEYGIQKHPCFCLRKRIARERLSFDESQDRSLNSGQGKKIFDRQDPILLENLTKKFGNFTAVDRLSLSIKKDEILTILGHNGAGKTTAIYMLTGMLKPSGGDATVYGYKISNGMSMIQRNLGLCQ